MADEMKTETDLAGENRRLREALDSANSLCRSAMAITKRRGDKTNWNAFQTQLDLSLKIQREVMYPEAALSGEPVPPALIAIRISEQQWQSLAQRIKAESGWNEVSKLMDESWSILQTQQQLVTAYLGDVKWIELPFPSSAVSPQDREERRECGCLVDKPCLTSCPSIASAAHSRKR